MKKLRATFVALIACITCTYAHGILGGEYFFDADPGTGNGTAITVTTPGDTVLQPMNISTAGLSPGPHVFCLRMLNDSGVWSHSYSRTFFVNSAAVSAVQFRVDVAEYFFDSDPGLGNGTALVFATPGDTVSHQWFIACTGLAAGPHQLCMRTRNIYGEWSMTTSRTFFITATTPQEPVADAEYFYDTDPGPGNGTAISLVDADTIAAVLHITNPFAAGVHQFVLRTRDAGGEWSHQLAGQFNVCYAYGANSDFTYFVDRKWVFFNNISQYDTAFRWEFGDGAFTVTERNPAHAYAAPGNYTVRLISYNGCATDTFMQIVGAAGLQSITPSASADTNNLTAYVKGIGFQPGCTVRLQRPGFPDILADTTVFGSSTSVAVIFKFHHNPSGVYNVIAENPSGILDTLHHAFTLVPQITHSIDVMYSGSRKIRTGRSGSGRFTVANHGNTSIFYVPVIIYFTGDTSFHVNSLTNLNTDPTVPPSITALIPPAHAYDTEDPANPNPNAAGMRIIAAVIPELGPGESQDFSFSTRSNNPGCTTVKMKVGEPLETWKYNAFVNVCNFMPQGAKCMMDLLGMVPIASCAVGIAGWSCALYNNMSSYAERGRLGDNKWDLIASSATTALSCVPGVSTATAALKIGANIAAQAANAGAFKGDCMKGPVDARPEMNVEICFGNSFDPNEKTGPAGITSDNYINKYHDVNYTIRFENMDTATAPAAEVHITDAIDTSKFDLSTFRLQSFGFGDSIYTVELDNASAFTNDIDLRSTRGCILRVDARLDMDSGLLKWSFRSFDTTTMNTVTNPAAGFLPPNVTSPEGEGFISYTIRPKSTLHHMDVVTNSATIAFDNNTPILTNTWINTIDTVKPASAVLPLTATQQDTLFEIITQGADAESGILSYIIYISENDSAFKSLYIGAPDTLWFDGEPGAQYEFFSQARDRALNLEDTLHVPDAVTVVAVGLQDPQSPYAFDLYPNPASVSLSLQIKTHLPGDLKVTLYSLDGMRQREWTVTPQTLATLSLDKLSAGSYYLVASVPGKNVLVKKVIILK